MDKESKELTDKLYQEYIEARELEKDRYNKPFLRTLPEIIPRMSPWPIREGLAKVIGVDDVNYRKGWGLFDEGINFLEGQMMHKGLCLKQTAEAGINLFRDLISQNLYVDYVIDTYADSVTDLRNKNRYIDYFIGAYADCIKDMKNGYFKGPRTL